MTLQEFLDLLLEAMHLTLEGLKGTWEFSKPYLLEGAERLVDLLS